MGDKKQGDTMRGKKSVSKNYIFNLSYQILAVLTPLITTPYLTRVLGADKLGTYSYTQSIVLIFAMFATLGTYIYGNREIAYVQNDKVAYSKVFWNIEILSVVSTLVVAACYAGFILTQTKFTGLYWIQIITLVSVATNISWLFQGLEEIQKVVLRNIVFRILSVAYIFIFIKGPDHLFLYVMGLVVLECIGNLSIWLYLPKYVERPHFRDIHLGQHFKGTLLLFAPTIATSIYTLLDKTIIGIFTDTKIENGYYEQSMKFAKTALTIVTALEAVMIPRVGALYKEGKEEELKELMYRVYEFVWLISLPLAFGLFSIADIFIPWFCTTEFTKSALLLKILCFLIPLIGISNVTGVQYLMSTKRENWVTRSILIGAAINLVLNLCLIPQLFSVGAAVASVVAEGIISAVQLFLIRKELNVGKILLSAWRYLLAAGVMAVALYFEASLFEPSAVGTIALIASGGVIYLIMILLLRGRKIITKL